MQMPRFAVPEALVTEILSKLPVKSVIRFNCVCKYWCSFQTPRFISKHYHNNIKNNSLIPLLQRFDGNADLAFFSQLSVVKDENFLVKQNIHFPFFIHDSPYVWGARHGLFCLHSSCMEDTEVAIWNPSTREFKILPPSSVQRPTYPGLTCDLVVFDCGAFEFDFKADDYKFIRFVTFLFVDSECGIESPDDVTQVELYSLKCDSWKEIPSPNYRPFNSYLNNNCLDGICYWQTAMGNSPDEKVMILSFDMANEKFSVSPILEFVPFFSKTNSEVLVFNGSVGVLVYSVEGIDKSFDLWVVNGGVWTKQFSIESIPGVVNPLGFWKNDELFLLNTNYEVVLFDPSTQELKVLGINTYLDHHREYVSLFFYAESLVSINGIQEHKDHIIHQLVGDASNIDQVDTKYDDG
ncbi:F-box/kelch-repeat protein At3g06240-like [Gossypium arboreum]|uniref:F-box/kelch-repeat protein At3g06240-like n=1 Tax=Gossypium arboreum TaxID=29729 RepID=UPI000819443E|nr:F-box/kelch-repeat protein At3g06240-like [Gossypium arboreum]